MNAPQPYIVIHNACCQHPPLHCVCVQYVIIYISISIYIYFFTSVHLFPVFGVDRCAACSLFASYLSVHTHWLSVGTVMPFWLSHTAICSLCSSRSVVCGCCQREKAAIRPKKRPPRIGPPRRLDTHIAHRTSHIVTGHTIGVENGAQCGFSLQHTVSTCFVKKNKGLYRGKP